MASLTTWEKAPVIVRRPSDGAIIPPDQVANMQIDHPSILGGMKDDTGQWWVFGNDAGEATLTVTTLDGRSGNLTVTVTDLPLVVELGDPVPKA